MRAREIVIAGVAGACLMMLWSWIHDDATPAPVVAAMPRAPVRAPSPMASARASAVRGEPAQAERPDGARAEREPADDVDWGQHVAELAIAFDEQRADTPWSQSAQADLQARVGKALVAGSQLVSLECRASLCRLVTSHAGRDELSAFVDAAFLRPVHGEPTYGVAFAPAEAGADRRLRSVAYLQPPAAH